MTTTENSRADALMAATLSRARSALYAIAKTYDDGELRAKALEAYEATFEGSPHLSGPDFEDGPSTDGFHGCSPMNGGHKWSSPYRERMDWAQHCTKCGAKRNDATSPVEQPAAASIDEREVIEPLTEPVTIRKALLAGRAARVVLSGGDGPAAAVHLVNIGLTGWVHTKETAEAYAKGFNQAAEWMQSALLERQLAPSPTHYSSDGGSCLNCGRALIEHNGGRECHPTPSPADERAALPTADDPLFDEWLRKERGRRCDFDANAGSWARSAWQARAASANETGAEGAMYRAGIEAVAKFIDKKAADYLDEYGYVEHDTGAVSWGAGNHADAKRDYHSSLVELAEEVREFGGSRSPAMAAEAVAIPAEVIAWRDAWQAYIDATDAYNAHLKYVRENCPFGTSVNAQYQAMNDAQRAAMALLKPMHAALSGAVAAPQPAQADAPTAPLAMTLNQDAPPLTMTILPAQADARIDVEAMLRACVPGGDICDPQRIADSIREWFDEHGQNAAQADARVGLTDEQIEDAIYRHIPPKVALENARALYAMARALHPGQPEPAASPGVIAAALAVIEADRSQTLTNEHVDALDNAIKIQRGELKLPEPRAEVTDDDKVCADRYRWVRAHYTRLVAMPDEGSNVDIVAIGEIGDDLEGKALDLIIDAARTGASS
ncbi:hypothetical protein E2P84_20445 [Burkholderia cepacia]|uniref:Uncharacterized protein n=1 Tax=Burkholderia cepacia TaxID=292 RepID=A0AAX2RKD9_BURCE|nr:hypothetical protein [Burkholderia cepacia]TES73977.1 hypothetical protein E2P84_20445 [Burkholderia cepacia]TET05349.1 hypothetical protein E3D36_00110 [Burkholderia cepacia]TEU40322.1 hypothetical protein E3D37_28890 [Burkholderia cepacia]TEU42417.1 hypothetical protein E3D39_15780 [Burkholderia cepacia]TEU57458.1 hypothetical protein E3D38_03255 [Burkholderia cepacia]